jgi:Arc/MetJ-type ribon-helix-helix transcriptional regulator
MTLSVRIPDKVEQELAEYCAKHRVTKSEAVKQALDQFLSVKASNRTPYQLAKDFIGADTDEGPPDDVARHTKRLLRERFRSKTK